VRKTRERGPVCQQGVGGAPRARQSAGRAASSPDDDVRAAGKRWPCRAPDRAVPPRSWSRRKRRDVAETSVPIRSRILYLQRTPQALCYDGIGATLYFSTLGVGSFSPLLPCIGFSWFVTFGPICKESLVKIPTDTTDKDIPGKQLR